MMSFFLTLFENDTPPHTQSLSYITHPTDRFTLLLFDAFSSGLGAFYESLALKAQECC